ncbi:MAG: Inositol transport system permease protein [uncultured Paraburkholderia sp.]|nr:MAG: Inositol transport system permease protein [uncultured Paraburkholderia sp.]CAH2773524.1 MAG: Inositol transport system permease protein [uncultured Paraburkholderia sp.]CAH2908232.1 MAG: Inositol transport system permease protein [uncultured Paraburkholderia sp.]
MRKESWFGHLLNRPEFAAISGAVLVFLVFALTAGSSGMFNLDGVMNWSQVSAYLGILAVGACLLMIAGEFDLSIGSMIGFAGMMVAIPTVYFHWPISLAILFAFASSMLLGALNGYLVMRTRLLSFIVTLAFLFILRGLTLALSIMFADRTIVSGFGDLAQKDWFANALFHGVALKGLFTMLAHHGIGTLLDNGHALVPSIPKVILWWFGLAAICSCLFAVLQVCDIGSAAADRGLQKEFEAIIAWLIPVHSAACGRKPRTERTRARAQASPARTPAAASRRAAAATSCALAASQSTFTRSRSARASRTCRASRSISAVRPRISRSAARVSGLQQP